MEYDDVRSKNRRSRMDFLHFYIQWVREADNEVWSSQQTEFINSLMSNASNYLLTAEEYLDLIERSRKKRMKIN